MQTQTTKNPKAQRIILFPEELEHRLWDMEDKHQELLLALHQKAYSDIPADKILLHSFPRLLSKQPGGNNVSLELDYFVTKMGFKNDECHYPIRVDFDERRLLVRIQVSEPRYG